MWIKLLTVKQIEIAGDTKTYYPGDWVEIGKQLAVLFVAEGTATIPDFSLITNLEGVGVTLRAGGKVNALLTKFKGIIVRPEEGENLLPFERTVIVSKGVNMRPGLLPAGVGLLDKWQIAVPFVGYSDKDLAIYRGDDSDKNTTRRQILDLRVPVYDTRLMFVRRCPDTRRLFEAWNDWRKQVKDEQLAFLCALWDVKPLILPLPTSWRGKR